MVLCAIMGFSQVSDVSGKPKHKVHKYIVLKDPENVSPKAIMGSFIGPVCWGQYLLGTEREGSDHTANCVNIPCVYMYGECKPKRYIFQG
jgi:hypothetical protein